MAGINQGRPEAAIGEPIRFGDDLDFEIEQHPISDRLIIRDTANGKEAYVRADRGGSIGGDGVLIKALKEGKPVADDGRTHDTIQQAERAASSFVFVPPKVFNENIVVNTEGLTMKGSGYNTHISGTITGLDINEDDVSVRDLSVSSNTDDAININSSHNIRLENITVRSSGFNGINSDPGSKGLVAINCTVEACSKNGFGITGENEIIHGCMTKSNVSNTGYDLSGNGNSVLANSIAINPPSDGVVVKKDNICIGNRIIGAGQEGIDVIGNNSIVANNRISDSTNTNLDDKGTNTVLDGNLTGPSN